MFNFVSKKWCQVSSNVLDRFSKMFSLIALVFSNCWLSSIKTKLKNQILLTGLFWRSWWRLGNTKIWQLFAKKPEKWTFLYHHHRVSVVPSSIPYNYGKYRPWLATMDKKTHWLELTSEKLKKVANWPKLNKISVRTNGYLRVYSLPMTNLSLTLARRRLFKLMTK